MATSLQELAELGQSPWIDFLSRPFVGDGELAGLIDDGIVGVTSNPTIFQGAIAESEAYDEQLRALLAEQEDPKEVFLALAREDVQAACDLLRNVFDRGAQARDGWVSLEVDPDLAYDAQATITEAKRLHALVDRPNLFVKIPGTEPGLEAIAETVAAGIPVNVTLLFSLERHRAAAAAYIRGLRRLHEQGGCLSAVASVASFFVSRVDTEADRRLEHAEGYEDLKGTLAIANAKLAYQSYKETSRARSGMSSPRRARRPRGACGPQLRPRTPTIETSSMSSSSSALTPWTPCPGRRSKRSWITAESKTPWSQISSRPTERSSDSPTPGSTTTTSPRYSNARACRSSPPRSESCSMEWPQSASS